MKQNEKHGWRLRNNIEKSVYRGVRSICIYPITDHLPEQIYYTNSVFRQDLYDEIEGYFEFHDSTSVKWYRKIEETRR